MDKIYIFGHKKPDTDSVTSAISLSYLKRALGYNTTPMILGNINNETKYVLEYFKVDVPKYLNDVKLQIKDLEYGKNNFINGSESVYNTFGFMSDKAISNIPIIDNDHSFLGTVSMKDISKDLIKGDFEELDTKYNNILNVLKAKELLRFDDVIKGHIIIASYRSTTFMENIDLSNDNILIVGDRHSIIEYAINSKIKMLILTGSSKIKEEHLELAKKNRVNIIKTDLNTFSAARMIVLSKPISYIMNKTNIVSFNENDYVDDFVEIANKTRYSYFPVVNNSNKCLGILKLADTSYKNKKKVILVDHNEYEQSADGLNEAEILEIIDHHKIGSIGTNAPINFRNMPVGSTNTIIYMLYKENHVKIPQDMAGLMLSGIISDTLLFKSPTTTAIDKKTVEELADISNIDYKEYALNMFKAGSNLKDKTENEIFYTDFKSFNIDNKNVGVSQVSTINADEIIEHKDKYSSLMNEIARNNEYYISALFITDILKEGSYIFYNESSFNILNECFGPELTQGKFLPNIISRKKQIIPAIMDKI